MGVGDAGGGRLSSGVLSGAGYPATDSGVVAKGVTGKMVGAPVLSDFWQAAVSKTDITADKRTK
jgi:hypothetical protein